MAHYTHSVFVNFSVDALKYPIANDFTQLYSNPVTMKKHEESYEFLGDENRLLVSDMLPQMK